MLSMLIFFLNDLKNIWTRLKIIFLDFKKIIFFIMMLFFSFSYFIYLYVFIFIFLIFYVSIYIFNLFLVKFSYKNVYIIKLPSFEYFDNAFLFYLQNIFFIFPLTFSFSILYNSLKSKKNLNLKDKFIIFFNNILISIIKRLIVNIIIIPINVLKINLVLVEEFFLVRSFNMKSFFSMLSIFILNVTLKNIVLFYEKYNNHKIILNKDSLILNPSSIIIDKKSTKILINLTDIINKNSIFTLNMNYLPNGVQVWHPSLLCYLNKMGHNSDKNNILTKINMLAKIAGTKSFNLNLLNLKKEPNIGSNIGILNKEVFEHKTKIIILPGDQAINGSLNPKVALNATQNGLLASYYSSLYACHFEKLLIQYNNYINHFDEYKSFDDYITKNKNSISDDFLKYNQLMNELIECQPDILDLSIEDRFAFFNYQISYLDRTEGIISMRQNFSDFND